MDLARQSLEVPVAYLSLASLVAFVVAAAFSGLIIGCVAGLCLGERRRTRVVSRPSC